MATKTIKDIPSTTADGLDPAGFKLTGHSTDVQDALTYTMRLANQIDAINSACYGALDTCASSTDPKAAADALTAIATAVNHKTTDYSSLSTQLIETANIKAALAPLVDGKFDKSTSDMKVPLLALAGTNTYGKLGNFTKELTECSNIAFSLRQLVSDFDKATATTKDDVDLLIAAVRTLAGSSKTNAPCSALVKPYEDGLQAILGDVSVAEAELNKMARMMDPSSAPITLKVVKKTLDLRGKSRPQCAQLILGAKLVKDISTAYALYDNKAKLESVAKDNEVELILV